MGGGQLPDPAVLLTIAVFLGGSLSGLATRRRTGTQIFAVLAASQLVFHIAFAVTATHAGHGAGGPLDGPRMLAFHLFAALAASALMAGGESTLFRLFAALHRVLVRVPLIRPVVRRTGLDGRHHRRFRWSAVAVRRAVPGFPAWAADPGLTGRRPAV